MVKFGMRQTAGTENQITLQITKMCRDNYTVEKLALGIPFLLS